MTSTKYAENEQTEAAKKAVAEEKKASERSREVYNERMRGKPTPTQEENDMAVSGGHILMHEYDGSELEDKEKAVEHAKSLEAERQRPQTYQTRQQHAAKSE